MNKIDIANGLIFQTLKINKDSFDDRLLSQKKIYLLEQLGVDLGYSYNWYIRGPYSPDLTTYIFNNLDMLKEQDFSSYKISNSVEQEIQKINNMVDSKPSELSVPSWYELLASVLYIKKNWNSPDCYQSLIEHKPQYTKEQYELAINQLKEIGL